MNIIGIDRGSGYVKVVSDGFMYAFPSVLGEYSKEATFSDSDKRISTVVVDGKGYTVGSDAIQYCRMANGISQNENTIGSAAEKAIILYVIGKMYLEHLVSDSVLISTGLPVDWFCAENVRRMRDSLLGTHTFMVEGIEITMNVMGVDVGVQPMAALSDYSIKGGKVVVGEEVRQGVVVIDPGWNTIDVVTIKDGIPIKSKSKSHIGMGCKQLMIDLQSRVAGSTGITYKLHELDAAARGDKRLYHNGIHLDVADMYEDSRAIWANQVVAWLSEIWDQNEIGSYMLTLLCGGGAMHCVSEVEESFNAHTSGRFAIASGYYKTSTMRKGGDNHG